MDMKKIGIIIAFIFSISVSKAEYNAELLELVHSAKSKDKLILIKVFNTDLSQFPFDSDSVSSGNKFIEATFYASNPAGVAIINEYRVESYPSIILLNSNGNLILPVKEVNSFSEVEEYMETASKMKYEAKPLAQLDLDYRTNKMNKNSIFEYIIKRTSLGLDNSEIIDKYTQSVTTTDLLNKNTLLLFLDENTMNIPGQFFSFTEKNQEEIKQILKLSDERFQRLTDKSIEYNFQKICKSKNESALNHIIDIKINTSNTVNREVVYNEYMTRYFHATYQPLKLANQARAYVNAIFKHKEQQDKEISSKNKRLFSPQFKNNNTAYIMYSAKLRDAAQYVVETLSAKSILNDALSWTITAEQFADAARYDIHETQAYILYKLGKKEDAINSMERAYNLIPHDNVEQRKSIGFNLIKMKRGEKIY
jgi:hypothetical protein